MLNRETNLTNSDLACNSALVVYDKKITSYNRKLISLILLHACNNDFVVRNNNFRSYNGKLISFLLNLSHENQDKWIAWIWDEYYAKQNPHKNDKKRIETYSLVSGALLFYYCVMQGTKLPSWFSECCLVFPRLNNLDLPVYKIEFFTEFTYLPVSYLYADSLHETHPLYLLTYNLFLIFLPYFYGSF